PTLTTSQRHLYATISVAVVEALLPLSEAVAELSRAQIIAETKRLLLVYLGRLGAELRDEHLRATALVGSTEQVVDQLIEALTPEVAKVTIRPVGFAGHPVAGTAGPFI